MLDKTQADVHSEIITKESQKSLEQTLAELRNGKNKQEEEEMFNTIMAEVDKEQTK